MFFNFNFPLKTGIDHTRRKLSLIKFIGSNAFKSVPTIDSNWASAQCRVVQEMNIYLDKQYNILNLNKKYSCILINLPQDKLSTFAKKSNHGEDSITVIAVDSNKIQNILKTCKIGAYKIEASPQQIICNRLQPLTGL